MRIFIITMEDPVYTVDFIKNIISNRYKDIIGIALSDSGRLKINKGRSKISYLFSLLFIMGLPFFVKNVFVTVRFKIQKILCKKISWINDPGLLSFANKFNIPCMNIKSPNNKLFLEKLRQLAPDLIINQSQYIIKHELLTIPSIGIINRHNALLPKNRGRLTPFWVLFNEESQSGVSIHFVDEGIDSGPIIYQEEFTISKKDSFKSIVKRNYTIAHRAMLKAIDIIEQGNFTLIDNDNALATYNTIPTLKQAFIYRYRLIKNLL